ncbi:MAG: hypothetical protein K2L42_00360 [Clostridia bacterium]|nr:hypothetical protein [Clostridia bacterium]
MPEIIEAFSGEKDYTQDILDLCAKVKDGAIRQIILGSDIYDYEKQLKKFGKSLKRDFNYRERLFNSLVNLGFAYVISKYRSLNLSASSSCETRIKHAIDNLYSAYNATDDVVRFVILNVALGLDASEAFLKKFDVISGNDSFYKNTEQYINIFRHIQKLRQAGFKTKSEMTDSDDYLFLLFNKLSFICDLQIVQSEEYADKESGLSSCAFKFGNKIYPCKYALVKQTLNEYTSKYLLLRSIDDSVLKNGERMLRLSYTEMSDNDTGEDLKVRVAEKLYEEMKDDRPVSIITGSVGKFYSYLTGDLLRKRHRMSFCNGLSSYKYYGELASSVMDALEMVVVAEDKQNSVVNNYILPVIKNNFNICKEDCKCTGVGCKFDFKERKCNKQKIIEVKDNLNADCVSNMDVVSILTILFSVVGCKEVLPQIFAKYDFADMQSYDALFAKVNQQLDKRFSDFKPENLDARRKDFYQKSIDYLSLNLDDTKHSDANIAKILKPFKIRAYTDALIATLENLDRGKVDCKPNPSENVYSIQSRIDLIKGVNDVTDVRSVLRDTLLIVLAYYTGLASCTKEQLDYEVKAEQSVALSDATVETCRSAIDKAFYNGARKKLGYLKGDKSFYNLFKNVFEDAYELKSDISIMLGREMVNVKNLESFIRLDHENKKCYLIKKELNVSGYGFSEYEWDLDNVELCKENAEKFVERVVDILGFFKGEEGAGARVATFPQVLTHTSSRVNVDNTTINTFTVYESEQYIRQKEYNVITYFNYEISKRYYYIAPKKFEKTRWITYPILIRCSEFYDCVFKEKNYDLS